ncbi:MAG: Hsp20/alpha crystallin family protein [Haloarculaceae archaeon]
MTRSDPFEDIEEMLDMVTGQFAGEMGLPVDVADTGDAFVVVADLPGYDAADLDVKLTDERTLSLAAERETETVEDAEHYVTRERTRESVSRTVPLPEPVDEEGTTADYDDGVLRVTLPKQSGDDEGTDIPVN